MYKFVPEIPSIQNLQSLLLLSQRTLPFNMLIPPTFPPSFFSTPIIPTEIYQNINNTPKLPEEELTVKAEEPKALPIQSKKIKKESVKLPSLKHEDSRKKKFWKPHEDAQVIELLDKLGQKWTHIGRIIGGRTGKQVRDRYLYTLNPSINRDKWSEEEDGTLAMLFQKYGNKWRQIALHMPGRTENQIKNRFNSRRKELLLNNSSPDMPQESPTCDTLSPIVKEEVKIEFDSAVGHEKTEY